MAMAMAALLPSLHLTVSSSSSSSFSPPIIAPRLLPQFPPPMAHLDTASFETQRLQLDAQARLDMMRLAQHAQDVDPQQGDCSADGTADPSPGAWKWAIRKRVWDLMEKENVAQHPRPVHHRIPNFVGAGAAAEKLASQPAFQAAKCVKVNPDTPQKQVRYLTLQDNKKLLTPQPRLRTGFFSELEATSLPPGVMEEACTSVGVAKYGVPLGIDAKLKVDLIVIGSVAVDPKTGARLGKGEGFAELEYGMLRYMGAIDDSTLVVTSIHDKQLVDDIPVEKLRIHDVPVDVICTPTHVIYTNTTIPKPKGIYWELLSPEKLGQIRVLQDLKKKVEKDTGQTLPTGPSEKLPPTAERRKGRQSTGKPNEVRGSQSTGKPNVVRVRRIFVWNLDINTTWRALKDHIANAGGEVVRVNILRKQPTSRPMARILLKEGTDIESLIKALDGSTIGKVTMNAKVDTSAARGENGTS